jgi:hypothetical protein
VEEGTHDELVNTEGLYAELFGMQAAGYRCIFRYSLFAIRYSSFAISWLKGDGVIAR